MKINREKFNALLAAVYPGVAQKQILEQSECFVFLDGCIRTFDDEVACFVPCSLKIEGAVQAKPLLGLLTKVTDEVMDVTMQDNELRVKGKRKQAGIRMDAEITLPLHDVELPTGKWKKIPAQFTTALSLVQTCAANENDDFCLTCIHVTGEYLEACDNYQATRYPMKTGVKEPMLMRKSSLAHVVNMAPTAFHEADNWMHYKNDAGLILSVRRHANVEDYPNLDGHFSFEGQRAQLPDLSGAVQVAEEFSADNVDANEVQVKLTPGKVVVTGVGVTGWYKEMKKCPYKGRPLAFYIAPKMLAELVERNNECEIAADRLRMDGDGYTYVTSLEEQAPGERKG